MPSSSQAQHKFVAAQATKGKKWAKKWLHEDAGWKKLPRKTKKKSKKKQYRRVMRGSSLSELS